MRLFSSHRQIVVFLISIVAFLPIASFADSFKDLSDKLIGEWRNIDAHFTIIVTENGDVFTQGGPLAGAVQKSPKDGGNFEFQGTNRRCNYNIAFLSDGTSDWGLVDEAMPNSCPKGGRFVRTANFNKPDSARSAPDKSQQNGAETIVENGAKDAVDPAPAELSGVTIVYFNKTEDDGSVIKALNKYNIRFSTRPPVNGKTTNVITCTPDASVDSIKKLAEYLISNGVEIRAIAPSIYPDLKNRLTIEGLFEYDRYTPLDQVDIENITKCPERNELPRRIYVRNECADDIVDISIRYLDPATNRWTYARKSGVYPKSQVSFSSSAGVARVTNDRFYLYARSTESRRVWSGNSYFSPSSSETALPYKLINSTSTSLTCSN